MLSISEIQQFINEDKSSRKKQLAQEANRYYIGENDILKFRAMYYNADGQLVEDTQRSNIKIPHNFFAELIDQKTQYILSNSHEAFVKSDYPELQKELDLYFDEDFKANLSDVITYGSIAGTSYMYRYADENGKSKFEFADATGIIEVDGKYTSDNKSYTIYYYVDRVVKDKRIEKILVWDDNYTYFFEKIDEQIIEDKSQKINPRPHIIYEADKDGNVEYDTFGTTPFFRFDNNRQQSSDLKPIKHLVDDYDLMNCSLSNNLESPDTIYFIKGMDGENLDQFIQNVKTKKALIAPVDGDMDIKTVQIPYEARKVKMDLDEQNIYRFGMGLNTSQTGDGNITNVVIKSRYSLLELKCNKAELQLKKFLKKIVKVVIDEINKSHNWDYTIQDTYFDFKREILVNELDNAQIAQTKAQTRQVEINTILNIASLIDNKTALELICEALEIDGDKAQEIIAQAKDDPEKELDETMQNVGNIPEENVI